MDCIRNPDLSPTFGSDPESQLSPEGSLRPWPPTKGRRRSFWDMVISQNLGLLFRSPTMRIVVDVGF